MKGDEAKGIVGVIKGGLTVNGGTREAVDWPESSPWKAPLQVHGGIHSAQPMDVPLSSRALRLEAPWE